MMSRPKGFLINFFIDFTGAKLLTLHASAILKMFVTAVLFGTKWLEKEIK